MYDYVHFMQYIYIVQEGSLLDIVHYLAKLLSVKHLDETFISTKPFLKCLHTELRKLNRYLACCTNAIFEAIINPKASGCQ